MFQKLGADFYVRPDTLERYFQKRTDLVESIPAGAEWTIEEGWQERSRFLNLDSDAYIAKIDGVNRSAASATHGLTPMLVPYEKYGESHPEYYSNQLKPGHKVNVKAHLHLCLSNAQTQEIAKKSLMAWMDRDADAVYFNVGHADSPGWCDCKNCQTMGSTGERYMKFVNLLAGSVADAHPNKKLMAIAYTPFSEAPPENVTPAENVVVLFAPYFWGGARSQSHPLDDSINQDAGRHFSQWLRILGSDRMIGYEYIRIYPYSLYPNVMFGANVENMRIYGRHPQVFSVVHCGWPTSSMADLFYYVIDQMMWDPEVDVDALIDGFAGAYYGEAGEAMREYFDLLQRSVVEQPHYQPAPYYASGLLDEGLAEAAYPIFDRAEKAAADDPPALARVRQERGYLLFADLFERNTGNGRQPETEVVARKLQAFLDIIVNVSHPIRKAKNGRGMSTWGQAGRGQLAPPLWIEQVSGWKVDAENIYEAPIIKSFIDTEDPAAFIRERTAADRREPSGEDVFRSLSNKKTLRDNAGSLPIVQAPTAGKVFISNPHQGVLHLAGRIEGGKADGGVLIRVNGKIAVSQHNPFTEDWSIQRFQISPEDQSRGWCELSIEYRSRTNGTLQIKQAKLLY